MKKVKRKLGKYELGRTIGEGAFSKVKFAQNTETGENVAIKVLAKSTILKNKMVEQVLQYTFFPYIRSKFEFIAFKDQNLRKQSFFRIDKLIFSKPSLDS